MRNVDSNVELLPIGMFELIRLADIKPSRVRFAVGKGVLPGIERDFITIKDVAVAALISVFDAEDVRVEFAALPARNLLYFLSMECRNLIKTVPNAGQSQRKAPGTATSCVRSVLTNNWEGPFHPYAIIYEDVYLRLGTKRLATRAEYNSDNVIFDLSKIAKEVASRIERPLVAVSWPRPFESVMEVA